MHRVETALALKSDDSQLDSSPDSDPEATISSSLSQAYLYLLWRVSGSLK